MHNDSTTAHTRRLDVIQISHTDETCAWSELRVLMDSKAASKLLLQNKPSKLSIAVVCW